MTVRRRIVGRLIVDDLRIAEQSLLGAVMLSRQALEDVQGVVSASDFYEPKHEVIFEVIESLVRKGSPVDAVTVVSEIGVDLQRAGGAGYPHELTSIVPTAANAGYYAEIVHEAALRRQVANAGTRIVQWAPDLPMPELADKARKEVDDALGVQKRKVRFLDETIKETIDSIGQPHPSIPSPWPSLNDVISGFRHGALSVVGARPAVGKTSIGIQVALELARHGNVLFSSLEMSERELHFRCMAAGAWIPHAMLEAPQPLPPWANVKLAKWFKETPKRIVFDDRGSITVNDVRVQARSVAREGKLAGVVVDYLQLISGTDPKAKRLEIVGEASRQLKLLAKDLGCPVIALSQLNRNSEGRADKRPQLADLRESGDIEQNADVVLLLHRDMDPSSGSDDLEVLVAKNRHGATRAVSMDWHGQFMAVTDRGREMA